MLDFIAWVIVGAILGWAASLIMGTDAEKGLFLNVLIGVVGAFVAALILTPLFGVTLADESAFNLPALLVSLAGAAALLVGVNLLKQGKA
jgi:uncharacterized membrane protein YeaQ/YmgE (transglycosylase-associated protein family)